MRFLLRCLPICLGIAAAWAPGANAQQGAVKQSGNVTPGHVSCWTTTGVVQDCGTPANPLITGGIGILSTNQTSFGISNAKNTGPYNQLGFGVTGTAGYITMQPFGGATALPLNIIAPSLNFIINGVSYPFGIFSFNPASPPPIGNITPNTGAFTSLNSANGALNGSIGLTAPSTGAFTTLSASSVTSLYSRYSQLPGTNGVTFFNLGSSTTGQCGAFQWWCSFTFLGSSGTITGFSDADVFEFNDRVQSSGTVTLWDFIDTIAPNGSSASGARIGVNVFLNQIGSSQGGTITNAGISTALESNIWMQSNLGGTSSVYAGEGNAFNTQCIIFSTATYTNGCGAYESDISASAPYDVISHFALITLSQHNVRGLVNSNGGITIAAQGGALADLITGIKFADHSAQYTFDPYARFIDVQVPNGGTLVAAAGEDFGHMTFKAFSRRIPFSKDVTLQATNISGVTRLTSDGAAASSFVYDAWWTNRGTGYTSNPTITVTGCTGAPTVNGEPGAGGSLGLIGVYARGSGCLPESTAAVSGGGGASGAVALSITGNTLNFPINSTVSISCTLNATTITHAGTDSVGFSIKFGATMGATASTAAIVGSPTWAVDYQTTGAAAKFSGSAPAAPAADTTMGGINISATPTSGSWDIGGKCVMVGSALTI